MKRWPAPRNTRAILALGASLLLVGCAVAGFVQLLPLLQGPTDTWPITLALFGRVLGLLAALGLALLLLSYARREGMLSYELDRNAIYVLRSNGRYIIPLDRIVDMAPAQRGAPPPTTKPVHRFGAANESQTLLIETAGASYRLAVRDRNQFAREVQERRHLGIVQRQAEGLVRFDPERHAFTSAPAIRRLLVVLVVLNLALWSLVSWRYLGLPETVPVRFDPLGGTAGTRSRAYVLLLPLAATAIAVSNSGLAALTHARTRMASQITLLGAILAQLALIAATVFIVRGIE